MSRTSSTRKAGRRTLSRLVAAALFVLAAALPAEAQILGGINTPAANSSVGQPFTVTGWAVFAGDQPGTGIDAVHVYGCPVLSCGTPTFWGAATYGLSRPDVAAAYNNSQYQYSGYSFLYSGLTPNTQYYVKVQARRTSTQQWYEFVVQFTATATPLLGINSPTHLQAVSQPVSFTGWAIDASAPTGTGVTAVDVWSYPNPGSGTAPQYLGAATYGGSRPDVAAAFGSRFQPSGYTLSKSGLTPGEHLFLIYAYSPTNGWFVQTTTNYVDIPTVGLTIDRNGTGTGGVTASGLTCSGGASTQAVPCGATYAFNTVVTLTAVPDSGSAFSGWFGGGCSGVSTCQITMSNAKVVMAMFSKPASGFTVSYYHTDRTGSVRAMTDATGALVGPRHDYAPFGEDTQPLTGNPMRFGGKELDAETGLHHFPGREYRNTWGRFTQVDVVSGSASDPQSWNRYAYARNNPLKFTDPTGLTIACSWGPGGAGAACADTVDVSATDGSYNGISIWGSNGMTSGGTGMPGQCAGLDGNGNFYMWIWCEDEGGSSGYSSSAAPNQTTTTPSPTTPTTPTTPPNECEADPLACREDPCKLKPGLCQPTPAKPCSNWGNLFPEGNAYGVSSGYPFRNDGVTRHDGIDILSPEGTVLQSPFNGTIVRAGLYLLNGNTVDVVTDTIPPIMFTGIHLLDVSVKPGDRVTRGQTLGRTGGRPGAEGSGNSRGVHLHMQLKIGGALADPTGCYSR